MKKGMAILLTAMMLLSLAACGETEEKNFVGETKTPVLEQESITEQAKKETEQSEEKVEETENSDAEIEREAEQSQNSEIMPEAEPEDEHEDEADGDLINGMRPEFKEAMDSYEAFYDEYCEFMKEYNDNSGDLKLLLKYTELMSKMVQMNQAFEKWDEDGMNDAELKYYLEVNNRVTQKLLEVAAQ